MSPGDIRNCDCPLVVAHDRFCTAGITAAETALPNAERLARAICAERQPTIPPEDDDLLFVDDECRSLARRVIARLRVAP